MGRTFIGNPYNNEISEDSDAIDMDDEEGWDNIIFQFHTPAVVDSDISTEEDNFFNYDVDGEGGDSVYDMFDDDFGHGEIDLDIDDDDEEDVDYEPDASIYYTDDEDEDDFEPGPPINYRGYHTEDDESDVAASFSPIDESTENDQSSSLTDPSLSKASDDTATDKPVDTVPKCDTDSS